MAGLELRQARLPEDEPSFVRFIDGLQAFERPLEPNRRIDAAAGADYWAVLKSEVAAKDGRIFVLADGGGRPVGWAVCLVEREEVFVIEDERSYGLITELYIDAEARGAGGGRRLIEACEGYFREKGLGLARLGVLWGNSRARGVYEGLGYQPTDLRLRKRL